MRIREEVSAKVWKWSGWPTPEISRRVIRTDNPPILQALTPNLVISRPILE
jgi:hypothetical protein